MLQNNKPGEPGPEGEAIGSAHDSKVTLGLLPRGCLQRGTRVLLCKERVTENFFFLGGGGLFFGPFLQTHGAISFRRHSSHARTGLDDTVDWSRGFELIRRRRTSSKQTPCSKSGASICLAEKRFPLASQLLSEMEAVHINDLVLCAKRSRRQRALSLRPLPLHYFDTKPPNPHCRLAAL